MLQGARSAFLARLLGTECAQRPLNTPARMFSGTSHCSAVGRWQQVWDMFKDPNEGKEGETNEGTEPKVEGTEGAEVKEEPKTEATTPQTLDDEDLETMALEYELTEEDKDRLAMAHRRAVEEVKQQNSGKVPVAQVYNMAGEGIAGWARLADNPATEQSIWELDYTCGRVPENEKNALLSRDAKLLMAEMKEEGATEQEIALYFRVRVQRVMAILALLKMEKDRESRGKFMHDIFAEVMEGGGLDNNLGFWDCDETMGSGERHVKILPRAPHYEARLKAENPNFSWEELEEKLALREEAQLISEFRDRLAFNLGEVGKSIKRDVTKSNRPKRPKQGFSLLVKPLGSKKSEDFVAEPSGNRRKLTKDESFMQHRKRVRPRRKLHAT